MLSYLGDFGEDDPSVPPALPQGLHVSQERFPLLDFLHHWTGRGLSVRGSGGSRRGRGSPPLGTGSTSVLRPLLPLGRRRQGGSPPTLPPQRNWPIGLTFFKPVQLRRWGLLLHRRGLSLPFLWLLPRGKNILESSLLLLQIPCWARTWPS